jgi:adenylate cyclase, class 2
MNMATIYETEIKLKIQSEFDAKLLVEKFKVSSITPPNYLSQQDIYYDTINSELQNRDLVIRTRELNNIGYVALKSPRVFIADTIQKRIELEFEVQEFKKIQDKIIDQGLKKIAIIDKKRIDFEISKAHIAIDELPFIGWFIEIEGENIQGIEDIIHSYGLGMLERIKLNYGELLDQELSKLGLPIRPNLNASFKFYNDWLNKKC